MSVHEAKEGLSIEQRRQQGLAADLLLGRLLIVIVLQPVPVPGLGRAGLGGRGLAELVVAPPAITV